MMMITITIKNKEEGGRRGFGQLVVVFLVAQALPEILTYF
jgi:hypothetical protein